jgi:ABC-type phosphate/phosphonate transport system permease subunit
MKGQDVLVIGSITFFVGFVIALISTLYLGWHLSIETYNSWSTSIYISIVLMLIGAILAVPVSLLLSKEVNKQ